MTETTDNEIFFANFVDAGLKLADLHDYLNDVSQFIERKKRYKERTYQDNVLKETAITMFTESFTSLLLESTLISVWVFMEAELKGYCNAMQRATGIKLSYSDLKGSAVDKFRVYTSKVTNLDFGMEDVDWEDLKAINEMRNSVVHSEGSVGNKKLVTSFLKRHKLSGLLPTGKVLVGKNDLSIIISICRLLIDRIYATALRTFPGRYSRKDRPDEPLAPSADDASCG